MPSPPEPQTDRELRIVATTRPRAASRLDDAWLREIEDPSPSALAAHSGSAHEGEALWLWGGEPCLRADLPEVIAACARASHGQLGLRTDALALRPAALEPLREAGLRTVRVTLHSSRAEAHDWLVKQPGAARSALRNLRSCIDGGLSVEVEATVTRPTAPQLPELLLLCQRMGVRRLHLRRLVSRGAAADDFIALSPRMGLLEPLLVELASMLNERTALALEGFPRCVAGAAAACCRPPDAIRWSTTPEEPPPLAGCPACPGTPECAGAPADYVQHFGRGEFASEDGGETARPLPPSERGDAIAPPPPRSGRAPATRERVVIAQVDLPIEGDPLSPRAPREQPTLISLDIPAGLPSRAIRQKLVRVAQEGAAVLCIAAPDVLRHPAAAELLRECTRLSFERVELHTDLRELASLGDAEVYALRGLHLVVGLLAEVADYAETAPQLERMARLAGADTAVAASVATPERVLAFADAWARGELPGPPRFRLDRAGGSLAELRRVVEELPAASAAALAAELPACLRPGAERALPELGGILSPRRDPCLCSGELQARCPGVPTGWSLPA